MPESEKMRVRADQLGELAKGYAIVDPPDIDLERWVRPDELLPTQGQCYREMGVEVVPDSRGFHMASEVSGLQTYICTARFTVDPDVSRPSTRDQAKVFHEYHVAMAVPCLRSLGYQPSDPPSLETFLDLSAAGRWWDPREELGLDSLPGNAYEASIDACPQAPPWVALVGVSR